MKTIKKPPLCPISEKYTNYLARNISCQLNVSWTHTGTNNLKRFPLKCENGISTPLRAESCFVSFYKAAAHSSSQICVGKCIFFVKRQFFFLDRWTARQEVIGLPVEKSEVNWRPQ